MPSACRDLTWRCVDCDESNRPDAVVAVVASAGGVEALSSFVAGLPSNFSAAVLVVLHLPPHGPRVLPGILARAGALPARHPMHGETLQRGVIFVAPPDRHLTVNDLRACVLPGPKEHGHRPSADALLRSVAESYGTRCAGVVLSGTMDDGAAGLRAIRTFGGLAMVQDPEEALFPGMPVAAIEVAETALVYRVNEMGKRLEEWLAGLGEMTSGQMISGESMISAEALQAPEAVAGGLAGDAPGSVPEDAQEITAITCPDCGGALWKVDDYGAERYRCRVGHVFSGEALLLGTQDDLEAALWAAIVALEEKADLCRRVAKRLETTGRAAQLERYRQEIVRIEHRLGFLRRMVEELIASSPVVHEQGGAGAGSAH